MRKAIIACIAIFISISAQGQLAWQWARGAMGGCEGWLVTTDGSGNVYGAGHTYAGTQNIYFGNTVHHYNFNDVGAILVKYDKAGNVLWSASTSNGVAEPMGITTDGSGNLIMLGIFYTGSVTIGSHTVTGTPNIYKYFLAKYDSTGNVLWAQAGPVLYSQYVTTTSIFWTYTYLSPHGAVGTDPADNIYIAADFISPSINIGAYTLNNTDNTNTTSDVFVAKYDGAGNVLWAKSAGGSGDDYATGIAVTAAGNAYVAGPYDSPGMTFGGTTINASTPTSIFLAKYDGAGNTLWAKNASGQDPIANGVAADDAENVYITGGFMGHSMHFDTATVTRQAVANGTAYLVKYDGAGNVQWGRGGSAVGVSGGLYIQGFGVATGPCGTVWLCGTMDSSITFDNNLVINAQFQQPNNDPLFIAEYGSNGQPIAGWSLASGGDDNSQITVDKIGNVFVCGDFEYQPITLAGTTLVDTTNLATNAENLYVAKLAVTLPDTIVKRKTICFSDSAVLQATTGYGSYTWDDGSAASTRTVYTTGNYAVVCISTCPTAIEVDSFYTQKTNVNVNFSLGNDTTACGPVVLQANVNGASYLWQDGTSGSTFTVTQSGVYYVTASEQGCSVADTIKVDVLDLTQHLKDTLLCSEQAITVKLQANAPAGATVLWSNGSTDDAINATATGRYWVTVKDSVCTGTDTMTITAEYCDCNVGMPNAFTPNKDTKDEIFRPVIEAGCPVSGYSFAIYNRWGQQVFLSKTPGAGWDGTFNGVYCDVGTYYWMLKFDGGLKKKSHFMKGDVTLIR